MSYFKQIVSRTRLSPTKRSQNLPLLNPPRTLFRPIALVQPLELADESLMTESHLAPTISSATQSISPSAASYLPSPTHLPATTLPITAPQATTPTTGLSLPAREQNPPASPVKPTQAQDWADRQNNPGFVGRSLPTSPSPQVPVSSSNAPDLQRNSPQHLVPIIPTKYSGIDPQPLETPKPFGHQATVDSASATNLTKAIAQPLQTTLEPKRSTQILPTQRITEPSSPLTTPRSSPGTSSQSNPSIHIGAIDIQITPPPVLPKPPATRQVAAPTGSLSRGFTSSFGLRQG
jgi:hypothetical protein